MTLSWRQSLMFVYPTASDHVRTLKRTRVRTYKHTDRVAHYIQGVPKNVYKL